MRCILSISVALALSSSASAGQGDFSRPDYPILPTFVSQADDLVPAGWKSIALETGDLNGDQKPDIALLMRMTNPDNIKPVTSSPYYTIDDTNPYLLAIGFAKGDGFELAVTHHALFPREHGPMHADGPPHEGTVTIKRGVLILALEHLRGSENIKFRWDGNTFALIGYDCAGVTTGQYTSLSANYLTRIARYERGRISDEELTTSTVKIMPAQRPNLEQLVPFSDWRGTDTRGNWLGC